MTLPAVERLLDHYERFLRAPHDREVYRASGFDQSIQSLRFRDVFDGCFTMATLGFGRLSAAYLGDFVEVVLAVDVEGASTEHLLVQTLFAIAENEIAVREGVSVGGIGRLAPSYADRTGKTAFYFAEPSPFPGAFRYLPAGGRLLLAIPISSGEHALVKRSGGDVLEDRLEEQGADPFDLLRASVA